MEFRLYCLNAFFDSLQIHPGFLVPGHFKLETGGEELGAVRWCIEYYKSEV